LLTRLFWPRSDEKCNLCLQRGASFVINYKSENFVEAVNGLTKVLTPCMNHSACCCMQPGRTPCMHASIQSRAQKLMQRCGFICACMG
jgi:hypothetical protein